MHIVVFRLFHIVCGVLWVGAIVFVAVYLAPSIRAAGPAGGPVMNQLTQVRKMPIYMMALAVLTIISGLGLMQIDSAGAPGMWMQSGPGKTFAGGGLLAIIAAVVGMILAAPSARKIGAIGTVVAARGGAPTSQEAAEIQRLQARMGLGTQIAAVLAVLATVAMSVARYMPS
jgi:hypothetical protein